MTSVGRNWSFEKDSLDPPDASELREFALDNDRLEVFVSDAASHAARETYVKTYFDLLRVAKKREDLKTGPSKLSFGS